MSDKQPKKKKRDGLFLRNGVWWFRRQDGGKRRAVSTGVRSGNRHQAERRKVEIEKDWNDGKFGWKEQPKAIVPLMATYLLTGPPVQHAKDVGGSASSWPLFYQRLCEAFPGRRLDELTPSDCRTFLGQRRLAGDTENYIRTQFIVYRATWNRAIADRVITASPWADVTAPKEMPRARILSYDEQSRLLDALSPCVRRAAIVALSTGVRNAELCQLERGDVDVLRGRLTVRAVTTKSKKVRVVPLTPAALAAIKEQMHDLDYGKAAGYFPTYRDGDQRIFPYAKTSLVHSFSGFVLGLGMQRLTIHDLRRTYATRHAENGVPMPVLQKWMGHSDITITARFYTHVDVQRVDFVAASTEASERALAAAQDSVVLAFRKAVGK